MTETIASLAKTINELYEEFGTWELVGKHYDVSRTIVWRIAKDGYNPTPNEIRRKLGLPERTVMILLRDARGRFAGSEK